MFLAPSGRWGVEAIGSWLSWLRGLGQSIIYSLVALPRKVDREICTDLSAERCNMLHSDERPLLDKA